MTEYLTAFRLARGPAAAFVAMGAVWGAFMAVMPDIKGALGADDARFGQLLIWGSVAAIAMMNLAPRIGSPLGRAALPLFTALMGAALALQGGADSMAGFALALMAMGASTGALDVFMNARVGALEAAHGRPLMNLTHALYSLGFAAAAVLTGWARAAGWGAGAILLTTALGVLALAIASHERDGGIEGLGGAGAGKRAAPGRVAWLGGALVLIGLMAENAVEAWSALFIERDLGGATGAGSLGPALLGATMGLGRLAGQGLAQRLGDHRLLVGGLGLAVAGIALVIAAPGPLAACAGFGVLGLGGSVVVPTAMTLVGRLSAQEARSAAIARATVVGYVGYFLGPPLMGLVASAAGLRAAFGLIALILLAGLVVRAALGRQGA
ncbi:MAG: MFS transporter [Pararhodobacter sp.]